MSFVVLFEGAIDAWEPMLELALAQTLESPEELEVVCVHRQTGEGQGFDAAREQVDSLGGQAGVSTRIVASPSGERDDAWAAGLQASSGDYLSFLDDGVRVAPGIVRFTREVLAAQNAQLMCFHMRVYDPSRGDFVSTAASSRCEGRRLPNKAFRCSAHAERFFQLLPRDTASYVFSREFLLDCGLLPARMAPGCIDPLVYRAALEADRMLYLNMPLAHRSIDSEALFGGLGPDEARRRVMQAAELASLLEGERSCLRASWARWAVDYALEGLSRLSGPAQEATLDSLAGPLGEAILRIYAESTGADDGGEASAAGKGAPGFEGAVRAVKAARMSRAALFERALSWAEEADESAYERAYLSLMSEQMGEGAAHAVEPSHPRKRRLFRR